MDSKLLDLADLNWRRLQPVRRALVVAAEAAGTATWRPEEIRIEHAPGESALAWLLIGWLASRLDWPVPTQPRIEETPKGHDVLSVAFGEGKDRVRAVLDARRVTIASGGETRSVVGVPQEGEADAVAAELHALSHDACLHDALSALLRSFRAA
jgi:glucose-6-phosphate dehydrogenase assembly protein OpcA